MRESVQENLYPDFSQEFVASVFMVDMLRVGRTKWMFAQMEPGEDSVRTKKTCGPKKGC
jgi:hypothetical protein